ncbi:MAG: tyrosine-type recombinase/integrase [Chloroflexi bacterium]|nr:tyrosine-type recombinase/integrase [Chloroflexota bacterium]
MHVPQRTISDSKILRRGEIAKVLAELHRLSHRSKNSRLTLTLFRLTTCCGLRVSEATGLRLRDICVNVDRPRIKVPAAVAKGRKVRRTNGKVVKVGSRAVAREVSLLWDAGTLDDLRSWKEFRERQGASANDFFLCSQQATAFGRRLDRRNARVRFIGACQVLGPDRAEELTVHSGRHSFCSLALAGGRSLAEVRQAAGHASVATTNLYVHLCTDDDDEVGNLFDFSHNNGNGDPR